MNRDDIIRMAREVGLFQHVPPTSHVSFIYDLMEFTALVAAEKDKQIAFLKDSHDAMRELAYKTGAAEEREACARVCDKRAADYQMGFEEKYEAQACAYDIRARGEA